MTLTSLHFSFLTYKKEKKKNNPLCNAVLGIQRDNLQRVLHDLRHKEMNKWLL